MPEKLGNPFEHGPFVQVAAFCERVLRETDGVLSLIRIVDVITHKEGGENPPRDMPPFRFPLSPNPPMDRDGRREDSGRG